MSKLRDNPPRFESEFTASGEGDLAPYVVFTQLRADGPYVYAGWLDAADDAMAIAFAREHYGQDQKCLHIWAIRRDAITGTDAEYAPGEGSEAGVYQVFVQSRKTDQFRSVGAVDASGAAAALDDAKTHAAGASEALRIWVVPSHRIASTDDEDLIWRHTDQSYRLARGYAKEVREKWEKIRERRALEEYEKDDLQETF